MENVELLSRGVVNIIPGKEELQKRLSNGEKLNIYLGIDPTATSIHLGHAVALRKLQEFANLGHNVTFLIGDFTALIGDTSDKDSERPVLTNEQILENFRTYKSQAEKVLDFSKVQVKHNSEWLKNLTFEEIIKLCQNFSFGDFASRELIKKRLSEGKYVGLHEALYPVMQGYDSYFLKTDIQIGGADQTFNMQAGRTLIKNLDDRESFVISVAYLTGTDGRKMSKSWGNAIWLTDTPEEIFRKVMAINDDLITEYFTLATNLPLAEIETLKETIQNDPMHAKKILGKRIVSELYSEDEAQKAEETFKATVQEKGQPAEIPEFTATGAWDIVDILVESHLVESKSDAKRLIDQGGVEVDGKKIGQSNLAISAYDGMMIKVGKYKYLRIKKGS